MAVWINCCKFVAFDWYYVQSLMRFRIGYYHPVQLFSILVFSFII